MPRTTAALLALSAVVLTGCEPTTDEVASMVTAGAATTYDDALELREDIIAAGLQCPSTGQDEIAHHRHFAAAAKRIARDRRDYRHTHRLGDIRLDTIRYGETRRRHPLALDSPAEDGIAYLECDKGMTAIAMAVASSKEDMEELVGARDNTGPGATPVLHAANWMVVAQGEAPLRQLQAELGGTIIPAS